MAALALMPVLTLALVVALIPAAPAASGCDAGDRNHDHHDRPRPHASMCGFERLATLRVSRHGGLGRMDLSADLAAVLQRDEGTVALIDISTPERPAVLGRFEDNAARSLDGDVAFSDDGEWLFYARQTEAFSRDGIHVLSVSDPEKPRETSYQPQGGTLRIAYHSDDAGEWVFSLDATHGLVVHRFLRPAGTLVPVNLDALPLLKVGGPASGGIAIDPSDPLTGAPLMYVTTGRTGLHLLDISDPALPEQIGAWDRQGLAEIERLPSKGKRLLVAATEYWFDESTPPSAVVLDATNPTAIESAGRLSARLPADALNTWRLQGMDVWRGAILAAHSHAGLLAFDRRGAITGAARPADAVAASARMRVSPYAMDVRAHRGLVYVSDAATGRLTVLRAR